MNQENDTSNNGSIAKAAYKFMASKKEQIEVEVPINEPKASEPKETPRKKRSSINLDYSDTFLSRYELASRQGLHLEKGTIATIKRIIYSIGDERLTVSGFVENVLKHHFEFYKEEVNRLHEEKLQKPIQ